MLQLGRMVLECERLKVGWLDSAAVVCNLYELAPVFLETHLGMWQSV